MEKGLVEDKEQDQLKGGCGRAKEDGRDSTIAESSPYAWRALYVACRQIDALGKGSRVLQQKRLQSSAEQVFDVLDRLQFLLVVAHHTQGGGTARKISVSLCALSKRRFLANSIRACRPLAMG